MSSSCMLSSNDDPARRNVHVRKQLEQPLGYLGEPVASYIKTISKVAADKGRL